MTRSAVPQLRIHRATGQQYVIVAGRRRYLGRHDAPDAAERYARFVAEFTVDGQTPAPEGDDLTIVEVCDRFMIYATDRYGDHSGEYRHYAHVTKALSALYGRTAAREFGPKKLKTLRATMAKTKRGDKLPARGYINNQMGRVRRVFKWAASEELVPASILAGLKAVEGLRAGEGGRETPAVLPVDEAAVRAVLPHLSRQVAAVVEIMLCTGARCGEIVQLRPVDIAMGSDVWIFEPQSHKNQHRKQRRLIPLGPKAQATIRPFLADRSVDAFCFDPREAERERYEKRKCHRRPDQKPDPRKTERELGPRYTTDSIRRAITRACDEAGVTHWHPHQIRHLVGTRLRNEFGIETASAMLGHAKLDATQLYTSQSIERAVAIAAKVG